MPFLNYRYYDLVDPRNGILKKGREVFLTGCYLRTAREGSGCPRLLPTEYLVILLDDVTVKLSFSCFPCDLNDFLVMDMGSSVHLTVAVSLSLLQDQDDDAMLIAAQFCSDSFSSISLDEANSGVSYSLYARYIAHPSGKLL